VAHQIFVGIAQQVVALGAIFAEIQGRVTKDGNQIGEAVLHLLPLAQLIGIVEIGHVDNTLEAISLSDPGNNFIDFIADLFIAFERDHIGKAATVRNFDQRVKLARIFVGDIFEKEEDKDIIFVLRGIHAATKFVTAFGSMSSSV
jgi:hypothetical protein